MTSSASSTPSTLSAAPAHSADKDEMPIRAESRQAVVHVVEWSRYPRRSVGERRSIAYTQDRSETGLGLDLPEPVHANELLSITLRDIDGKQPIEGLARVVWCRSAEGGRFRAGLSLLREEGERPMLRVRRRGVLAG
ncbi:MAG: PilZ domain-containing protein [Myxococcota bacterium]